MEQTFENFRLALVAAVTEAISDGATFGQVGRIACLTFGSVFAERHAEEPDNDAKFKAVQAFHRASEALEPVIEAGE